jgi:hypothetical protein
LQDGEKGPPPRMARRRMARSDAQAPEQDVPSVKCAKDGTAFDQKAQRFCGLDSV